MSCEDLRGGPYWLVNRSELQQEIDLREDENGKADAHLIAAAPAMAEVLVEAGRLLNNLNTVVISYLEGKLSDKAFISQVIPFSDGPERQRVAKLMNAALALAKGEAE